MALEKLTNQGRFIQMIIDKKLNVSNRRKADIVADLRKHEFRAFPKNKLAKEAGEGEEVAEGDDGVMSDFDYLLGMPIWSLTKEKIVRLTEQASDKEEELKILLEKSPKDMWNADLDLFLEGWEVGLFLTENETYLDLLCIDYREIVLISKRKRQRTRKERK